MNDFCASLIKTRNQVGGDQSTTKDQFLHTSENFEQLLAVCNIRVFHNLHLTILRTLSKTTYINTRLNLGMNPGVSFLPNGIYNSSQRTPQDDSIETRPLQVFQSVFEFIFPAKNISVNTTKTQDFAPQLLGENTIKKQALSVFICCLTKFTGCRNLSSHKNFSLWQTNSLELLTMK